jgi:vacuolar-type H+-ATPase subunit H
VIGLRVASIALAALAAVPAVAAAQEGKRPPRPGVLWQQYPLGSKRLTATAPARAATQRTPASPLPRPIPVPPAGGTSRSTGLPVSLVVLGAVAALLALLALVVASTVRSRRRANTEVAFAGSLATIMLAATRLEGRQRARGLEDPPPVWDRLAPAPTKGAARDASEAHGASEAPHEGRPARQGDAGVGERVAEIIGTAEELAVQITADAHEEAVEIIRQARGDARQRLRELRQEQGKLLAAAKRDASEIRSTVENYARERRDEAEAEAERLLAEAEAHARAMREAAEERAMRESPLAYRAEIEEQIRIVEARLLRFQAALREITTGLDALLEPLGDQPKTLMDALDRRSSAPAAEDDDGARTEAGAG